MTIYTCIHLKLRNANEFPYIEHYANKVQNGQFNFRKWTNILWKWKRNRLNIKYQQRGHRSQTSNNLNKKDFFFHSFQFAHSFGMRRMHYLISIPRVQMQIYLQKFTGYDQTLFDILGFAQVEQWINSWMWSIQQWWFHVINIINGSLESDQGVFKTILCF